MKVLILSLILLVSLFGCSTAAQVELKWTNPLNSASAIGACDATIDTCKNISIVQIWAQLSGRSDSTLVGTKNVAGKYGRPDSLVVNVANNKIWFFWAAAIDSNNLRSCNSPIAMKDLRVNSSPPHSMR